jgi:hypothetical protein
MTDGRGGVSRSRRFVLVYNADGTVRGELTYVVGHVFGTRHCELCDISHGPVFQKRAWKEWVASMLAQGHIVNVIHRNDMSSELELFVGGQLATVVEELADGSRSVVLSPTDLKACGGDVGKFAAAMQSALILP